MPAEKPVSVNHFYNQHKSFLGKFKLYGKGYMVKAIYLIAGNIPKFAWQL